MGSEASKSSREPGCLSFLKDISSSIDKDCYCEECRREAETHLGQIDQRVRELGVRVDPTFASEELEDSWTDLGADSTIGLSDESESLTCGDESKRSLRQSPSETLRDKVPLDDSDELEDSWIDLGTDSTISFSGDSEDDEVLLEIDLNTLQPVEQVQMDPITGVQPWYMDLGDGVLPHGSYVGVGSDDLQGSRTSNPLYGFHM